MVTEVIRSECDKIDLQITQLTTERDDLSAQVASKDADIANLNLQVGDLNSQIEELQAQIDELEAQLPNPGLDPIVMVTAASIPATAPVVGEPFLATVGDWTGGGGIIKRVHNWWVDTGNFVSGNHANPIVPSEGHIGKPYRYEEVLTFANGETRNYRTGYSLPVEAAPVVVDPPVDPVPPVETIAVTHWVYQTALGDGTGSSYDNAMAVSAMPAAMGPGVKFGLIADKGDWTAPGLSLNKGGEAGNLCYVMGVDAAGQPMAVTLVSGRTRPDETYDPEWARGQVSGGANVFDLQLGANFISFRDINFKHVNAGYRIMRSVDGLEFFNQHFENTKEGWWMDNDPEPDGPWAGQQRAIMNSHWRNIKFYGFQEAMFRLFGNSNNLLIEGVEGNSRRMMGHITMGIILGKGDAARIDTVHDVTIIGKAYGCSGVIEACHDTHYEKPWFNGTYTTVTNPDGTTKQTPNGLKYAPVGTSTVKYPPAWNSDLTLPGTKYWQGDGVVSERTCYNIEIVDIVCKGCTDGGFDLKSQDTKLVRCGSEDNKRNYRLWSNVSEAHPNGMVLEDCWSTQANKRGGTGGSAHIFVTGGDQATDPDTMIVCRRVTFTGAPSNAFTTESPKTLKIINVVEDCVFNGVNNNQIQYRT